MNQDRLYQQEDETQKQPFFDERCLQSLIAKMGFSEQSVFLEQGARDLVIEVANDFMTQLLEMSYQMASKKPRNAQGTQLTQDDINFILAQKFKLPLQSVQIHQPESK